MGFWSRLTGKHTIDDIAADLGRRFVASGLVIERYDQPSSTFHLQGGHKVFVGNVYAEWKLREGDAREEVLARFVRSTASLSNPIELDFATARLRLRPMVREKIVLEQLRINGPVPGLSIPNTRDLGAHLVMSLSLDLPDSIASVGDDQLQKWGVTCDAALEIAKENLRNVSDEPWHEITPGVFAATFGDEWDASRLAVPDVIRKLPVRGTPVALAMQRDRLLVTGRDDDKGLLALATVPEHMKDLARPMTPLPVELDGDTWKPLVLPTNHPAHRTMAEMTLRSMQGLYAQQKELLKEWSEKEDVFVSSFMAFGKDGLVFTTATCTSEIRQLMPRVERVAMVTVSEGKGHTLGILLWDDFAQLMGLTAPDQVRWPERWDVDADFTDAQLAEIERLKVM